jgi:hypothetical protein
MAMQEVSLNLFQMSVKPKKLFLYEMVETNPVTQNKVTRFRLAANIAKRLTKTGTPVFSAGELIFSIQEIPQEHQVNLDIEGTTIVFSVKARQFEVVDLANVPYGVERFPNKLVDWYCNEEIPNSFHMENVNYRGENIFARLESRLHKAFNINVNEGIMRTTRTFAGIPYLLLDIDYRVTWERSLWEDAKSFVKDVLNRDVYLPDLRTIQAINERFGRVGKKPGVRVQGKNRTGEYEVIEFDYTKNPDAPGTAGEKSQQEYFNSVYGSSMSIKDKRQPLVKVRVTKGFHYGKVNYHVPELLEFERIPLHLKENQKLMSALTNISKPAPRGRFAQILSFVQGDPFRKTSGFADDDFVKKFLEISPEPVTVFAQVLPPINIKMENGVFPVSSDSEFLKNIWKRKFHRVPEIKKIILLYDKARETDVLKFYSMLQERAKAQGMILPEPTPIEAEGGLIKDYLNALGGRVNADIVLTFAPYEEEEFYEAIKEELLIKQEILSQHISYEKTLDRIAEYERKGNELGIRSILTLIAMQLCAKLGGAPWAFNEPIYDADSPILGLDVFHEADSVTGGCAVFDPYGEYLFSDAKVTTLKELLFSVLQRYMKKFGKPKKLLILRDGLNYTQEQQFLLGLKGELETIKKVLSELGISEYILVMQKEGTRLRMYKKLSSIKVDNPDPGTVVIGKPFEPNEMLMVSQETYQGTVEPVMYKVLVPPSLDMEKVAGAVNKLARHHWNTYRAIKIPAPALHADKITYLVRRILSRSPTNPDLLDRPFYL